MFFRAVRYGMIVLAGVLTPMLVFADYSTHAKTEEFVQKMHDEHKFEKEYILSILKQAEKKQSILDAIARPAEKTLEWKEYKDIFLGEKRVQQGLEFWKENVKTLDRATKEYGVPQEIIVAIIGVETRYGRHKGSYRVIDALTTLGFDYEPRAKFFSSELEHFFLLAREQKQDPLELSGSYAGAMGYGQFIPSSYRAYAVDFDGDELADIWNNPVDAIGSVANYFKKHGWQEGEPVFNRSRISDDYKKELLNDKSRPSLTLSELKAAGFEPAEKDLDAGLKAVALLYEGVYGKEFWLGFDNFYVITRYNRSHLYAMAVWQLSRLIRYEYEAST